MTLNELDKLRRIGARPAYPVHITDCYQVHEWCVMNDVPCFYTEDLKKELDYRPMRDLDIVVVGRDGVPHMNGLKESKPRSVWMVGYYGWESFLNANH